jgi:acyl transferase domain-containing protein
MRRDSDTWQTLLGSLSTLYVAGAAVDWAGFDGPYSRQRRAVPGYDFSRKQYWLKGMPRIDVAGGVTTPSGLAPSQTAVYEIAWRQRPALPAQRAGAAFTLFADANDSEGSRLADALAGELRAAGAEVAIAARDARSTEPLDHQRRYVYLAAAERVGHSAAAASSQASAMLADLTDVLRALVASGVSSRALWVVTRRGVAVGDVAAAVDPFHSMLWGFGRTASLEHPDQWGGLIDIDERPDVAALARELMGGGIEDQIALRGKERFVPRLVPLPSPPASPYSQAGARRETRRRRRVFAPSNSGAPTSRSLPPTFRRQPPSTVC